MQITIHRALSQLKTTEARIRDSFRATFISTTVGNTNMSKGAPLADVKNQIKSEYDSITKLINNYETLKLAIIRANSGITEQTNNYESVVVNGKSMLVAEIIAKQKFVIPIMEQFVNELTSQYNRSLSEVESINRRVSNDVTKVIASISGGDSSKLMTEQVDVITKSYYDNNSIKLVDPLNLVDKINKLRTEIDDFKVAADAKLSEINALKTIEVNL